MTSKTGMTPSSANHAVTIKASEIMSRRLVTVGPAARVHEVARLLADSGISAVPVVDERMHVIGIVSEGDLMRRKEIDTKKRRSWWLEIFTSNETLALDYTKAYSLLVRDVMSAPVISVLEHASLAEIADILEEHAIKRVTVVRAGKLVGIVSRADLVRAIAGTAVETLLLIDDKSIRNALLECLKAQPWASTASVNFVVSEGVIELNGIVTSGEQQKALRVLVENIPGVKAVHDGLIEMPYFSAGI